MFTILLLDFLISGGTFFKINAADEAILFGIVSLQFDSNDDGIYDATIFSKIKYISDELGLQGIYID